MIRMWLLVRYFTEYKGKTGNISTWYTGEITRSYFVDYLLNQRHFLEDVRDKAKRLIYRITGVWIFQGRRRGLERLKKQRQAVNDVIDNCLSRNYLLKRDGAPNPTSSEIYLSIDFRGRNFIKLFPSLLVFVETCLGEYKTSTVFVFSVIGTGIAGTVAANWGVIWSNWTSLLSKFL
jgi:hypothetical protein